MDPKVTRKYEPPRDKTNKVSVRPAKTQISLGIHPVWSESGRMPRLTCLRWAHSHIIGFVTRRLIWLKQNLATWKKIQQNLNDIKIHYEVK